MGYVGSQEHDAVIGVLGGMGPSATLELYRRFIAAVDVVGDQDHPRIVIDSNARIPDRTAALIAGGPSPQAALVAGVTGLEQAGAQCVVIPCNTAHAFLDPMRQAVAIPVIDMIAETARRVDANVTRVGVLASSGTIAVGLYQTALAEAGFTDVIVPNPTDQNELMDVIWAVKRDANDAALPAFLQICQRLVDAGAQTLILGCTEFSVLARGLTLPVVAVDPLDALVDTALTMVGYHPNTPVPVVHS
jgi:aspartate racemase